MHRIIQILSLSILIVLPSQVFAQSIDFGDDSSDWANDGECDDRRFIGGGAASDLDRDDILRDATDCRELFEKGYILLVDETYGRSITQCDALYFGTNASEWANDGECDDPRFEGPKTTSVLLGAGLFSDAADCKAACARGTIWLRTANPN